VADRRSNEWWVRITHALESHVREETHFLDAYEELCESVEDLGTRFLIDLILADERRHHELFARLAASARGDDGRPVIVTPNPSAEEARRILEPTRRFLDAEQEDREQLRRLAKDLDGVADSLWRLLIQLMDLDTRKHVAILEYLKERLEQRA